MDSGGSLHAEPATMSGTVIQEGTSVVASATNMPTTNVAGNPNPTQVSNVHVDDQHMPVAIITRIMHLVQAQPRPIHVNCQRNPHYMRKVLPPHAKIADDAKESIQECVSEFTGHITTAADEWCHHEYRKTVTPEDVLTAMGTLGFESYVGPLTDYINKYRAEDPECGPSDRLPMVRCGDSLPEQPPVVQPPIVDYVPSAVMPRAGDVDGGDEYARLSEFINQYFMGGRGGGGENSSNHARF